MDVLCRASASTPPCSSARSKLLQLIRLIPFCERNYNLIELGPKGTGKSHVYAEFSPHGMLISGGEVTKAKLFVNNASGHIGLVGYWDCLCFDEFAGKDKRVDKDLVDIMKNYMANRSFSRGSRRLGRGLHGVHGQHAEVRALHAEALQLLRAAAGQVHRLGLPRPHPRLHPGWEVAPVRSEIFTTGTASSWTTSPKASSVPHGRLHLIAKPHAEIVRPSRRATRPRLEDVLGSHEDHLPHGAADAGSAELLAFGMEARRRVREHLLRIDETLSRCAFASST